MDQVDPRQRALWQPCQQFGGISCEQADVADIVRLDPGQDLGHAVDIRLAADEADLRKSARFRDQVFAAAKTDFEPDGIGRRIEQAGEIGRVQLTPADAVTLDCTTQAAAQEVAGVDLAADEHTVTAMQYSGPAMFLAVAARTVLVDEAAAENYLTRVRGSGAWLDQISGRLRDGARSGRLPVGPLAELGGC